METIILFTKQFYIVKSVIRLSIVTGCDDSAGPLLGGGGEEGGEEPGEGDHGQLAAAHRAVAVRGVPASAVKRSIGSTTCFHNHGEGPY